MKTANQYEVLMDLDASALTEKVKEKPQQYVSLLNGDPSVRV